MFHAQAPDPRSSSLGPRELNVSPAVLSASIITSFPHR